MELFALFTWITTAGGGLYLLSIWLIEYDKDFQSVAATRLPPPVLAAHVLMAGGGLLIWSSYLIFDDDRLAWLSVAALGGAVTLGLFMAIRWIGVYRASRAVARLAPLPQHGRVALLDRPRPADPPERNFPVLVVIAHGAFALVTVVLVLLTALGVGGS
jgi:hypothetical protein